MSDTSYKSKRVLKNTAFLYIRMLFILFVTLYTSRVLLDELGFTDFGIFNLVGGIASMFVFFSSSLVNATQRFLNVELSKGDVLKANVILNQHLILYAVIAVAVIVCAEIFGVWFIRNELQIPPERLDTAIWVFRFAMWSFAIMLVGIVFDSEIIAHEDMNVYSYVGLLEGVAKLVIVYMISCASIDKLFLYALLLLFVTIITQVIYLVYSKRHYSECYIRFVYDKSVLKETGSLLGWNLAGTAVYALNDSGLNVLLNMFFGPVVNAARALSYQVKAALNNFSANIFVSVRPQIVKSYAVGDFDYLLKLFYNSSRYSFFFLFIISIPIIFNVDAILVLWQGSVPEFTGIFTILVLTYSLVNILTNPIWTLALAVGRLKKYICVGSGVFLLIFPISYFILRMGVPPYYVMFVMIAVRSVYLFVVLRIIKEYIVFTFSEYFKEVLYPIFKLVIVSLVFIFAFEYFVGSLGLFASLAVQISMLTILTYYVGMCKGDRQYVASLIKNLYMKLFKGGCKNLP